ncbi:MAG TPA: 7-cyano-7-deazaguanine synthase QueC [Candidatus Hydrogenedentes bacterium]|jgi:7-cyano-7-deazaguanine synthase|nr:MAG: 7-cyano-7-deazaguanine synthase [Candidatus Hydrogenedentes bacterium ADurb.Bin170]HNZ47929.1 7-cyano-7-deazaguanine synthase QueC [Candidatus Hydrogenedentota bacterium]HOD95430.1 7-cyano-7-deazaguanine synthase QueC [Candidatus Hydrogenedentota bacterium]HOH42666.1 7-cyano-7-deazaguanine synthase QueC [Candidatus Hydrogenedentota bacterium]HOR50853.1 7-cyano-7-deazaguanine synthase QueC [Candidatus Hydrogenedentota bacterium]
MKLKQAAVVLVSGGLDSTVLLHAQRPLYENIHALSLSYGQRHMKELDCARYQAKRAGASFTQADLGELGGLLKGGSSLLSGGAEVPALVSIAPEQRDQPSTYVPNRNMMLLSIAAAFAEVKGAQDVFYGAQAQVEYGYWDCTSDFVESMNAVLALNRRNPVRIHAPFMHFTKEEIVKKGLELHVDFARTWSCYRGDVKPCGVCPTCVERNMAFQALHMQDPLLTGAP